MTCPAKTSIRLTESKWCSRWTPIHASHENYTGNPIADQMIEQKVGAAHRLQKILLMQPLTFGGITLFTNANSLPITGEAVCRF